MAMHRSTNKDRTEECGSRFTGAGTAQEVPVTVFAPEHMTAGPTLAWPSRGLIDALRGLPEGRWFQAVRSPSDIFHWRAYCDRLVELGLAEHDGKDGFKRSAEGHRFITEVEQRAAAKPATRPL